jgi:ferredoxin
MSIEKVWIVDGCTACGLCEEICPEVFEVDDEAHVKEGVDFNQHTAEIKESAESCPVEVIRYK